MFISGQYTLSTEYLHLLYVYVLHILNKILISTTSLFILSVGGGGGGVVSGPGWTVPHPLFRPKF